MQYLGCLLFFLVTITIHAQTTDPFPPSPVPDRIILSWSDTPATTQSVNWRTDVSVNKSWAEIAPASGHPNFINKVDTAWATIEFLASNMNVAHYHSATFKNLKPATKYAYRVGNGSYYSEWFHFTTASADEAPFSFLYFGDAQNDIKSLWSRCIREAFVTEPQISFLLHAGDLINRANNDYEWGEWCYAGGWIYGMKSNISTPGNHEYWRDDQRNGHLSHHWRPTFTLPENGPEGMEETVYYIDYQGTRIISLDSPAGLYSEENLANQKIWLEQVLLNNPNKWTIVTHHHPIYSTAFGRDNTKLRTELQPIYEKYGVDLILQGHDHTYGRGHNIEFGKTHRDLGPTYVVSVSGPKMYDLGFGEWLERAASNTQLFQIISVNGNTLSYKAYTASGELYDGFDLEKQTDRTNKFVDKAPQDRPEFLDLPDADLKNMSAEEIEAFQKRLEAYKIRKN